MLNSKRIGRRNQKQGNYAEIFVINNLRKRRRTVIPTRGSKSPLDIIAYHKRKQHWWGIQVKSTSAGMTFDMKELTSICRQLHFTPVLAYVKERKHRELYFCMRKAGRFYHVFEDENDNHLLGEDVDCVAFSTKISML